MGKTEVRRSLHTKDPREAALRHTEVAAKIAAEWEALRSGPKPLTRRDAAALAGQWYRWFTAQHEADAEDPDAWAMWSDELHDLGLISRPELDERDIPEDATRSPAAQRKIEAFLMDKGGINAFLRAKDIKLHPVQGPAFLEAIEPEFHAAMRLLARRADGDYRTDRRPERFPEWQPNTAPHLQPKATSTLTLTGHP